MKKFDEMVAKMHSHYVADDYIQIMLAYRDYLLLFGNNDLMYFKNFIASYPSIREGSKNVYLDDERKNNFPYSQIPEHMERVLLFRKLNFVNQILDFEKPYIRINDGFIAKMTAFKDGDEAIVHTKILNGKLCDKRTKRITREELETYLKTGSLEQLDENEYEAKSIFDMNGVLYNSSLGLEQKWIDEEKQRLSRIIKESNMYIDRTKIESQVRIKIELQRAISTLDDILPFVLTQLIMIKFKQNGEIKIDAFGVKYLERGKYEIALADLPVTMESLSMIKSKVELPVIKTIKEPKISRSLNPNVTKEQLQEERAKILVRSK